MRTLSAAYLAAAKAAGRYPNIYAIIYEDNSTLTITGKNAIISAKITRGDTAKPAYFEVGRAISSSASVTVDRRRIADESLIVSGAKIEIYAEFDTAAGAVIASEKLATMYISGYDDQDADIGIISAVDYLVYTGVDFNPDGLTYPVLCSALLSEAFAQAGLSGVSMTLPCDPHVNSAPYKGAEPVADGMSGDPYTCRDIIAKIAGMQMSDIFIDADGAPKVYDYGNFVTSAVTDDLTLARRVGSETFEIHTVTVYKTSERMAKSSTTFEKLPYGPRFEDMDDPTTGTWLDEIRARAHIFVQKDWTTATVTIAGVGELEPGDFVEIGTDAIPIFISGIVYNFEGAHFSETLYSFAYTLEEYYAAPSKATVVSTDVKPSAGECIGENIGNHSARINDLENNNVTEADPFGHNLLVNSGHTLNSCMDVLVSGRQNTATRTTQFQIAGSGNTAHENSYAGFMCGTANECGEANTFHGDQRPLIYGDHNVAKENTDTLTGGDYNNVTGCQSAAVSGRSNDVTNSVAPITGGYDNNVTGNYSLTVGTHNTSDQPGGITAGNYNVALNNGLAIGDFNKRTGNERLAIGNGSGTNDRKNVFYVMNDGTTYAKVYNTTGADYAEFFEWADGNPDGEDRRGLLVKLVGDKIAAAHGDEILGAVSCRPSVIGNAYEEHWRGKYKTDIYGDYILDDDGKSQLSDDYDPEREYIPRSQRQEWAAVGMIGRLIIRDNGKCQPGGYVSARQGIGVPTFTETRARCIRRLDGSHIDIIVR